MIKPSPTEMPIDGKRDLVRALWRIPTPLGASLLAAIVVAVFVTLSFINQNANTVADTRRAAEAAAVREYEGSLETYKAQITAYVACRDRVLVRDDLRNAFFDNFDGLIALAERFNAPGIAEQVRHDRESFNLKYKPLDKNSCVRPVQPEEPPNLPSGVVFGVPQIPEPYNT